MKRLNLFLTALSFAVSASSGFAQSFHSTVESEFKIDQPQEVAGFKFSYWERRVWLSSKQVTDEGIPLSQVGMGCAVQQLRELSGVLESASGYAPLLSDDLSVKVIAIEILSAANQETLEKLQYGLRIGSNSTLVITLLMRPDKTCQIAIAEQIREVLDGWMAQYLGAGPAGIQSLLGRIAKRMSTREDSSSESSSNQASPPPASARAKSAPPVFQSTPVPAPARVVVVTHDPAPTPQPLPGGIGGYNGGGSVNQNSCAMANANPTACNSLGFCYYSPGSCLSRNGQNAGACAMGNSNGAACATLSGLCYWQPGSCLPR